MGCMQKIANQEILEDQKEYLEAEQKYFEIVKYGQSIHIDKVQNAGAPCWINTPGHSYLKVRVHGSSYSGCSFSHNGYMYLEEDCDAPAWLKSHKDTELNQSVALDLSSQKHDVYGHDSDAWLEYMCVRAHRI